MLTHVNYVSLTLCIYFLKWRTRNEVRRIHRYNNNNYFSEWNYSVSELKVFLESLSIRNCFDIKSVCKKHNITNSISMKNAKNHLNNYQTFSKIYRTDRLIARYAFGWNMMTKRRMNVISHGRVLLIFSRTRLHNIVLSYACVKITRIRRIVRRRRSTTRTRKYETTSKIARGTSMIPIVNTGQRLWPRDNVHGEGGSLTKTSGTFAFYNIKELSGPL